MHTCTMYVAVHAHTHVRLMRIQPAMVPSVLNVNANASQIRFSLQYKKLREAKTDRKHFRCKWGLSSSQDVEGFCIIHLICMGCWPDFIQLYDHFTHEKGVKPNFSFLYFCERVITVSVEFMTAQSGHFCQRPSALKDHHILCQHSLFNMTN